MLYFGNKHIVEAYLGDKEVSHIDIEGNSILIPIKANFIIKLTAAYGDKIEQIDGSYIRNEYLITLIENKPSDWKEIRNVISSEEHEEEIIIKSSTGPTKICFGDYPSSNIPDNCIINFLKEINYLNIRSEIIDMSYMFCDCEGLTYINTSNLDIHNVTNMSCMFELCSSLRQLDVSKFDTSNVTDMSDVFSGCSKLTNLDVSNWDTSNVTIMNSMFQYCPSLTGLDVSNWDTSNVTDMNSMFRGCSSLRQLDLSNFDTSNVTNIDFMFEECVDLEILNLSNFNLNKCPAHWTGKFLYGTFNGCELLHTIRLDNCNKTTINKIIISFGFPTGTNTNGIPRVIYCKKAEAQGLIPPEGWSFSYV